MTRAAGDLSCLGTQVDAVRSFGGPTVTVKLHGKNYDEASEEALRLSREEGLTMVHPFDDPDVIAGQGASRSSCLLPLT